MREQNTKLHMSALLPLGVFALFAVCVLSVLLTAWPSGTRTAISGAPGPNIWPPGCVRRRAR